MRELNLLPIKHIVVGNERASHKHAGNGYQGFYQGISGGQSAIPFHP